MTRWQIAPMLGSRRSQSLISKINYKQKEEKKSDFKMWVCTRPSTKCYDITTPRAALGDFSFFFSRNQTAETPSVQMCVNVHSWVLRHQPVFVRLIAMAPAWIWRSGFCPSCDCGSVHFRSPDARVSKQRDPQSPWKSQRATPMWVNRWCNDLNRAVSFFALSSESPHSLLQRSWLHCVFKCVCVFK